MVKILSRSAFIARRLSKRIIKKAIQGIEIEYNEIRKYREDPVKELEIYVDQLFGILKTVLLFVFFYFIVIRLEMVFTYIYYGLAANGIFRIMAIVFIYNRTISKIKNFEKYEAEVNSRITYLNSLLTDGVR